MCEQNNKPNDVEKDSIKSTIDEQNNKQQASDQKISEQQASEQQTSEQQTSEQQASEQQTSEQQASEQQANEQQTSEQQASEQQANEQQAGEQQASEQQTSEQQASEQQASEQQAGEQQTSEQQASEKQTSDKVIYKIGDDVSAITGRPHISPEENAALKASPRFFEKALQSSARARGEEYEHFRLPAHMRAALSQIDEEATREKAIERLKEKYPERIKDNQAENSDNASSNHDFSEEEILAEIALERNEKAKSEASAIDRFHSINPDEIEEASKESNLQNSVASGGARFYSRYQEMMAKQNEAKSENKASMRRNLKIAAIVAIGLMGYVGYNEFFVDKNAQSIAELKAALPITMDEYTSMVRIDDRNDLFKIYIEKDPSVFASLDESQKNAVLDNFAQNAQVLCKTPLLNDLISSGRKVTVLLEATDRSFSREFAVEKCPEKK